MYITKYFTPAMKQDALDMAIALHDTFVEVLNNTKWLDDQTREDAVHKADIMTLMVGYATPLANQSVVAGYYKDVMTQRCVRLRCNLGAFS